MFVVSLGEQVVLRLERKTRRRRDGRHFAKIQMNFIIAASLSPGIAPT